METRQEEQDIDIVNDETAEPDRTAKRLHWTEEEDIRLVRLFAPFLFMLLGHSNVF